MFSQSMKLNVQANWPLPMRPWVYILTENPYLLGLFCVQGQEMLAIC